LHFGPGLEQAIGPRLLSSQWINGLQELFQPAPAATPSTGMYSVIDPASGWSYWRSGFGATPAGIISGHSALGVLVALAGGLLALLLADRPTKSPN
jgi:hypothetical protein